MITAIPDGFVEVSRDRFFAMLYADKRDIMPNNESPTSTFWRVVRTRDAWGWSAPGWSNPRDPKMYAVRREVKS